jgi:hypothetical protein
MMEITVNGNNECQFVPFIFVENILKKSCFHAEYMVLKPLNCLLLLLL